MEHSANPRAEGSAPYSLGKLVGPLCLLGLLAWHGLLTLSLFGPEQPWQRLADGDPILNGQHPLHLYHGALGSESLLRRGSWCCYDPAFHAGYPKTPVFDGGSRPAELFLTLAGGGYNPAAYKVGLAVTCLAVPGFLILAARAAGLGWPATATAALAGLLVFWGAPGRRLLEEGDLDILLASLAAAAQSGLLVRFDRAPGLGCWLGLAATGILGWFAHPGIAALLLPLTLVYYVSTGTRHRWGWHAALAGAAACGVLVNLPWLATWAASWWIRVPFQLDGPLLLHRTLRTLWDAPLWGDCFDRGLALALLATGLAGAWCYNETQRRPAARQFGLGSAGLLTLAVVSVLWEPMARLGTWRFLPAALWLATVPAAHALAEAVRLLGQWAGGPRRVALAGGVVLAVLGIVARDYLQAHLHRYRAATPLTLGLDPERAALVEALAAHTAPPTDAEAEMPARILWEDAPGDACGGWTVLLPHLTGRAFLGGLDPRATIEHTQTGLVGPLLVGRPVKDWSDLELEVFCRKYNLGWAACHSTEVLARLRLWPAAREVAALPGDRILFRLPHGSYARRGKARLVAADARSLVLADVVPEEGKVLLSFHYQAGLRAAPARVLVERETDPSDPIPFVRLRLPGPIACVTLTWEE